MEWIIGFLLLLIFFTPKKRNTYSSGGPNISTSTHPNAGLIRWLSPEESHDMGLLPHVRRQSCGCVTYYDDLGASASEYCQKCSDEYSPF